MSDSAAPGTIACQAPLSFTISQSLSDSCSVSQWCYLTLLALNVGEIVLGTNCSGVNEMMLLKVSMCILKDKHIECFESLKWLKINVCQFSFSNKLNNLGICWEILPQGLNTKQKSHWNTWLVRVWWPFVPLQRSIDHLLLSGQSCLRL